MSKQGIGPVALALLRKAATQEEIPRPWGRGQNRLPQLIAAGLMRHAVGDWYAITDAGREYLAELNAAQDKGLQERTS